MLFLHTIAYAMLTTYCWYFLYFRLGGWPRPQFLTRFLQMKRTQIPWMLLSYVNWAYKIVHVSHLVKSGNRCGPVEIFFMMNNNNINCEKNFITALLYLYNFCILYKSNWNSPNDPNIWLLLKWRTGFKWLHYQYFITMFKIHVLFSDYKYRICSILHRRNITTTRFCWVWELTIRLTINQSPTKLPGRTTTKCKCCIHIWIEQFQYF